MNADKLICAVCGGTENVLTDCEYHRRGFGAVCAACCEECHESEPFPCREYDRRQEQND